jgi:nicotinamidase-related amidase
LLQKNNINHLVVVGLDISYCVNKTAQGALNRGYQVTAIQDAVIGGSPETEKKMLGQFHERGIELMSTVGYLERMQQH